MYTRWNIHGIKLKIPNSNIVWTVNTDSDNHTLEWVNKNKYKRRTNAYSIDRIVQQLNDGNWIVVNEESNYLIYN